MLEILEIRKKAATASSADAKEKADVGASGEVEDNKATTTPPAEEKAKATKPTAASEEKQQQKLKKPKKTKKATATASTTAKQKAKQKTTKSTAVSEEKETAKQATAFEDKAEAAPKTVEEKVEATSTAVTEEKNAEKEEKVEATSTAVTEEKKAEEEEKVATPASAEVKDKAEAEEGDSEAKADPSSPDSEAKADVETSTDTKEKEATNETSHYFQGIGTLYGRPYKRDDGEMMVSMGKHDFRLSFRPGGKYKFNRQVENNPSTELFLRVYPKVLYIPRKTPEMYFVVVAWREDNQWQTEPGIFALCGIWQFIAPSRLPVISVYRNPEAPDPTKKFKATHLPVRMRREGEVQPFRFNPKTPKEDLPKKWFIQGNFRLLPEGNCFEWVEDIEPPTDWIPRYRKPFKAKPKFGNKKFSNPKKVSKEKTSEKQ
ncbi:MAG: hypothetical protein SAJ37_13080 [Oscillatoria sp. PMC 1068.18]|nr:hypothetical protein [Oscillatoria sp. PMC 1076.18]MEC4989656.1 hypothetical protein [Oscillatoria sp. PMC 1068.18]